MRNSNSQKPIIDVVIKDDGGDMSVELFNAIVHRWQISNQFLTQYLRRSMDSVKSYRYKRLAIPQTIADKMRKLHVFLAMADK